MEINAWSGWLLNVCVLNIYLRLPDWNGGASTPAKAVMFDLLEKRLTSPSSAISWGPMARRYHEIKGLAEYTARLHLGYKNCILLTKVAFGLQKLHFVYKYLVVEIQSCISGYNTASRFAIE